MGVRALRNPPAMVVAALAAAACADSVPMQVSPSKNG
jgi:hypothetical protein